MKHTDFDLYTDEQLVISYLNGNGESFSILYRKYFPKVYSKCYGFTRNSSTAFDLAQDVLIKAYSKLNTFKGGSRFSTWLFAITYNYCIETYRKKKNILFEPVDDQILPDDHADTELSEWKERKEQDIRDLLLEIPEIDRQLLKMKYEHNFSIKDLQDSYNLSASAVKMRLQRARNKIGQIYLQRNMPVSA